MKHIIFIVTLFVCITSQNLNAKVKLPSIISNHMILQRESKVKLWGWSNKKGDVEITTSWNSSKCNARISSDGKWETVIETGTAGGPYTITLYDGDATVLEDIYLGEVWLCSGQSNMEMPIRGFMGQPVEKSTETVAAANPEISIRLFKIDRTPSKTPMENCPGSWKLNTPESVSEFSAVAYFFGTQLYKTLNIPIGLVCPSWGGSAIQSWMTSDILKQYPEISQEHLNDKSNVKNPHAVASMLYNGMISPIKNYKFKGVIWYQGESNRNNPTQYESLFQTFVNDWRAQLNDKDLPFYYVQIAPYCYDNKDAVGTALLRQAQYNCEDKISNVGMVITMDIGNETCIHPEKKMEVGNRLAYMALNKTYGIEGISCMSPRYHSHEVKDNKIIISFERAPLGITSFYKPLLNFEIAGDDNVYYPAQAVIVNRNKVQIWHDGVKSPKKFRYAYKNFANGDLFGVNGMPVSSFIVE